MNAKSFLTLFTAGTLVWSNLALGGEIHTAASRGDVEKAKALLATVKGGDKTAIAAAPDDMWNNGCQVCHKSFREKKSS